MKEVGLKRTSDALLAQESAWTNRHIEVIEDSAAPPLNGSIVAVFIKTTPPSVSSKNKDAENPRWDIHLRYRPKPRGAKKQKNTSFTGTEADAIKEAEIFRIAFETDGAAKWISQSQRKNNPSLYIPKQYMVDTELSRLYHGSVPLHTIPCVEPGDRPLNTIEKREYDIIKRQKS